ncbi:MAG TPA: hypothetical protein DIC64_01665 [Alphaproteobacteria bacterium]|nr:hypothetical protein [Alphaproteobacteria bacterium]
MRKIWVFALLGLLITTSAKAKVCFLPGIFGGDENCLTDSQYAECEGFEQTTPCPAGQEQVTCTKGNKVFYHCYCRADTYNLVDHPEYRCKKGYTTECGCSAENLECAPEYVYKGDGRGHCAEYANTDGIGACVLPNGEVFYKDCECNKDMFPYSCRDTGFKRPIENEKKCKDPHGAELYSKCECDENAGWSENCAHREDACTQPVSQNTVGEVTCSQCEEIVCESDDFVNIEAYLCGASKSVTFDCETLGYIYAPAGVCPPGTGNEGKTGVKCPFDRNYMNCDAPEGGYPNEKTCLEANEGATQCASDPDNKNTYHVTECDEENGYYFDGSQCQISSCPIGYSTAVKTCVGDGYTYDTNGKSGGENCAKCICEPSETCIYTSQKNDVATLAINGKSLKAVYAGNATVSGLCCNGYFKTCTSQCSGRNLLSDYDANMEEYEICEACGEKYYTVTKCKDSFEIRDGRCIASACDTINGFTTEIENGSQCKTVSGLYEGALGWILELQKNSSGEVVRSAGVNCAKCVCSEPVTPSATTACRWSNFNKNTNGYLKEEDLCCNGYYKSCYADFPPTATPEACNDAYADQKDVYAACDYANACIIRSCKSGYTLEGNKCVAAECAAPYSSIVQDVSECGAGNGWNLDIAQDSNQTYIKSGERYCTQCQCNAAANCSWDESNKGTSSLSDLCCNGKYATCTSSCSGYLESNLVSGSGASVEQGVATRTECKACGNSYWMATSCKTDNGYQLTSDGRCERVGCPSGYTTGLTECDDGFIFEAHAQTDNGETCGRCVAKTCADYDDYPLDQCPTNWDCIDEPKKVGSVTKTCYAKDSCKDSHCGIDCATIADPCNGYDLTAIENATMGNESCEKRTGGGTNMCSEITTMYKTFTCNDGFRESGNSCVAKECADYDDYPLDQCPKGYGCPSASKKLGNMDKTCYAIGTCAADYCGENCATETEECVGYDLPAIENATMGSDHCEKVTGGGTSSCVKTTMYKTFTCNDGFRESGNSCVAKECEDYTGWFATCPDNWTCTKEAKKTGNTNTMCYQKDTCDASHCGSNCSTETNDCVGYPYEVVAHATMSNNKCSKITGGGTNMCSAVTLMFDGFECDDANGWTKNLTNSACVAKTCSEFAGYYEECPGNKACEDRDVTLGGIAKKCKVVVEGCASGYCGADCATAATTCSGAYTSEIENAIMQGECSETCSDKKTWEGFECESGYKKSGNTCVEKSCADNTDDGYIYDKESACKAEKPNYSCTSRSNYQLGDQSNQTCWKASGCDNAHCGTGCATETNDCADYPYSTPPLHASLTGDACHVVSGSGTNTCNHGASDKYKDFECNTGWKKNAAGTECEAKSCDDNRAVNDPYIYGSQSACEGANPNHTCSKSTTTYELGENISYCWKVNGGCDSSHCGEGCTTEVNDCARFSFTESNKPAHSDVSGTACEPVLGGGTNQCTSGEKRYSGFTCKESDGWMINADSDGCTAKPCDRYDDYKLSECPENWECESKTRMVGGVSTQCWKKKQCDSSHCGADCSTALQICPPTIFPYETLPAHATAFSGAECTPISGTATCTRGTTKHGGFVCDTANGWTKSGNSCVAMTCEDYGLSGYSTTPCAQGYEDDQTQTVMLGGVQETCRTCKIKQCPAGSATTSANCGTGRILSTVGGNATGYSGGNACYPCECDQVNGYYDEQCPAGAGCENNLVNSCYKTTGCATGWVSAQESWLQYFITSAQKTFYVDGNEMTCVKAFECNTTLATMQSVCFARPHGSDGWTWTEIAAGCGTCEAKTCPINYTADVTSCGCGESYSESTTFAGASACGQCTEIVCSSNEIPAETNYVDDEGDNYGPVDAWKNMSSEIDCDTGYCKSTVNTCLKTNTCTGFYNAANLPANATLDMSSERCMHRPLAADGVSCGDGGVRYADFKCNTGYIKDADGTGCCMTQAKCQSTCGSGQICKTFDDSGCYQCIEDMPTVSVCTSGVWVATDSFGDDDTGFNKLFANNFFDYNDVMLNEDDTHSTMSDGNYCYDMPDDPVYCYGKTSNTLYTTSVECENAISSMLDGSTNVAICRQCLQQDDTQVKLKWYPSCASGYGSTEYTQGSNCCLENYEQGSGTGTVIDEPCVMNRTKCLASGGTWNGSECTKNGRILDCELTGTTIGGTDELISFTPVYECKYISITEYNLGSDICYVPSQRCAFNLVDSSKCTGCDNSGTITPIKFCGTDGYSDADTCKANNYNYSCQLCSDGCYYKNRASNGGFIAVDCDRELGDNTSIDLGSDVALDP